MPWGRAGENLGKDKLPLSAFGRHRNTVFDPLKMQHPTNTRQQRPSPASINSVSVRIIATTLKLAHYPYFCTIKLFYMKQLLLFALFCPPAWGHAQCVECSSFAEALKNPLQVKSIIINSNVNKTTVRQVPAYIDTFVNLEILYLTDQPITHIPPAIGRLPKLKELSFAGCRLTKIPDAVFALGSLKELILLNNPFASSYKTALRKKTKSLMPNTMLLLD
jgi:hypothetical protein